VKKPRQKHPTQLTAAAGFDQLPDAAFVRLPVVRALLGISQPTAWRWVHSGRLPAPTKLSDRVSGFNVGQLRAHLAAQKQNTK